MQEKRRLIAERAANFLAWASPECDLTGAIQSVGRLYRTRNAVVHGEAANCEAADVLLWKDLVRTCLRGYLSIAASEGSQKLAHARVVEMGDPLG